MAALTQAARKNLPTTVFAISANASSTGEPQYPIQDQAHAIAALARVETNGTAAEKAMVRNAVRKRYPNLPSSQGKGGSAAAKHNFAMKMGNQIAS